MANIITKLLQLVFSNKENKDIDNSSALNKIDETNLITETKNYFNQADYVSALQVIELIKDTNNADILYIQGKIFKNLGIYPKNKYLPLFEQAAKQNHPKAKYELSQIHQDNELITLVSSNIAKNQDLILYLANNGDYYATMHLMFMYKDGAGVDKDDKTAIFWLEKAYAQGSVTANFLLAHRYFKGDGVTQDHNKAIKLFEQVIKRYKQREYIDYLDYAHIYSIVGATDTKELMIMAQEYVASLYLQHNNLSKALYWTKEVYAIQPTDWLADVITSL